MKVEYNKELDILTIKLRDDRILESDEIRPGVIVDYNYDNQVVGLEILNASNSMDAAGEIQYVLTEQAPGQVAANH